MNQTVVSQLNEFGLKLVHLLETCKSPTQLAQIQAQIILHNLHPNTTVASHFIDTCKLLGLLDSALLLFHQIQQPHVFICNSIIRAFSHSPSPLTSVSLYTHMHKNSISPTSHTFPFLLKSVSHLKMLKQGQMIHAQILKLGHFTDIYVLNSLLNLYSSCGHMSTCEKLFDEMPVRDVVSWTTLIQGNRNAGKLDDALLAFERMQFSGVLPNRVTMVNALSACASAGALEMGMWIHDFIKRNGWEMDVSLGTSLIDVYGKCGNIDLAFKVFETMKNKNVFTWNSLIKGLALAKSGNEAIRWFSMMEMEGIKPDEVTLIGVLSACSHSGMVQQGLKLFHYILDGKYGFPANVKHYSCVIDMLARAGSVDEAFMLIEVMPYQPTKGMWGSLFSSCRAFGDLEMSELAARRLVELDPGNAGYYVLLSNLYAEMQRWADVEKVRRSMKERGLEKNVANSYIKLHEPNK